MLSSPDVVPAPCGGGVLRVRVRDGIPPPNRFSTVAVTPPRMASLWTLVRTVRTIRQPIWKRCGVGGGAGGGEDERRELVAGFGVAIALVPTPVQSMRRKHCNQPAAASNSRPRCCCCCCFCCCALVARSSVSTGEAMPLVLLLLLLRRLVLLLLLVLLLSTRQQSY